MCVKQLCYSTVKLSKKNPEYKTQGRSIIDRLTHPQQVSSDIHMDKFI